MPNVKGNNRSVLTISCIWFLSILLLPTVGLGQTTSGTFVGTVTDTTGAVIPDAGVNLVDSATGVSRDATTDATGRYEFLNVAPGIYDFAITFTGFQTLRNPGVILQVNQDAIMDFVLEPGAVTEEVTVRGQVALINTTNATVGTVVEQERVTQLPLNGRQFSQLILLTPGAVPRGSGQQTPFEISSDFGGISPAVNGARGDHNNFTIDGVANNELFFNFFAISPPPDAIQEFKVQSNMSSGAFGRGPGANVSIVTRRGGNEFHGSVWEFIRNDVLDAADFFDNLVADTNEAAGLRRKPTFRQNQFGFTAGGPIRREKAWIFGYYEGFRKVLGKTQFGTVPSAAQLGGDLSGLPQIFDPFSTTQVGTDPDGNAIFSRTPFPNNQIPSNLLNSASVQLAQLFYAAPNIVAAPGEVNFTTNAPFRTVTDQFGVRADGVFRTNTSWFGRFSFSDGENADPGINPGLPLNLTNIARQAVVSVTHTFNPTSVLELHAQYLRTDIGLFNPCADPDLLVSLGLAQDFPAQVGLESCQPGISMTGFDGIAGGTQFPIGPTNSWEYRGVYTKIMGDHTVTVGGSLNREWSFVNAGFASGSFDRFPTSDPQNPATTGAGLATYLLGIPTGGARLEGDAGQQLFGNYYGTFINDEWKVTPKLTLTLGLRYDYHSPLQEERGHISSLDWNNSTPDKTIWLVVSDNPLTTDPSLGNPANVRSSLFAPDRNNFAPRISFAYRLSPTSVIRAGYGIFYEYNQSNIQTQDAVMGQWPFSFNFFAPVGLNSPSVANPTPTNIFGVNSFPARSFDNVPPVAPGFAGCEFCKTPYVQTWNIGIDKSFGNDWSLTVAYLGSKGTKLGGNAQLNSASTPGPGPIAPRSRLPQFAPMLMVAHWYNSNYHSGQLKVQKRFSQGLNFLLSYTYSKAISDGPSSTQQGGWSQNAFDRHADRGLALFDLTHNLVFSYVYELPIGPGKRFLGAGGWASKHLLGGWQVTGILSLNNGFPFAVTLGEDNANVGHTSQRPSVRGPLVPSGFKQTRERWFDTDVLFKVPFTYGNLGKNPIRQDGYQNFDFGLVKQINITEVKILEFRTEFFNITNRPNFAPPNGNFVGGGFGQVFAMNGRPRIIQFGLKFIF